MNWIVLPSAITVDIKFLYKLIDSIGTNEFDVTLLEVINKLASVPVAESLGYMYVANAIPIIAGYVGIRADTPDRVEKYTQYYLADPLLHDFPKGVTSKFGYVKAVYPKDIEDLNYRKLFFEKPNFGAEVNIAFHEGKGWNVMKFHLETTELNKHEILHIGKIASLLYPIAKRHVLNDENEVSLESRAKTVERLLFLLNNRFPQLTEREAQVCALTILGKSAPKIAKLIDVSSNTVITYRQRAYSKLGVSSANALVSELL